MIPVEQVNIDRDQLEILYSSMGEANAEDAVSRAIEELAMRMSDCERLYKEARWAELRRNARSLVGIAEQVGVCTLSRVARDVINCIDIGESTALAATLSRMIRIGERSLSAIFLAQDDPI